MAAAPGYPEHVEDGVSYARIEFGDGERFATLRRELGVQSFGINALAFEPGQRGRIHRHERQEEVYVVLEGELTLAVEGEERTLRPWELARVAPDVRRQLLNKGPDRLVLLALGGSGGEHASRDGHAYASWEVPYDQGKPPQEVPLPEDLS